MRKLRTLAIIAIIGMSVSAFAQKGEGRGQNKEQLEALKIAFITQELNLSSEEAQTFWPMYNEMEGQLKEVRKAKRENQRNARKNFDVMSEKEVEKSLEDELALAQQELDIKRSYVDKFKGILSVRKVAKLYAAEERFKQRLLKRFKEKRKEGQMGGKRDF